MNELLSALTHWLADYLALATALLAIAALAMWRLKEPSQRMATAWATMAGLTALLVATAMPAWPRWDVRQWILSSPEDGAGLLDTPTITYQERVFSLSDDANPASSSLSPVEPLPLPNLLPTASEQRMDWPSAAALAWLACAVAAVGWIALGALQAWRLLWTASQSPLWAQTELARLIGRRRKPRLKTSTRIGSAVALGAVRPAILLPTEHVREDNRAAVQAALAHEWAHIRHGDLWLLAWQRLLLPILAVHPLFWLLRRQIRADQELLADIAAAGEKPVEYAEALLAWAKESGPRPSAGLAALAMWENPETVSRRIQMILDPKHPVAGKSTRRWRWLVALTLIGIAGGLSLVSIRSGPVAAQEDAPVAGPKSLDAQAGESQHLSFFYGQATENANPASIEQVELSLALVKLGKEGEEVTQETIRDLGKHFAYNQMSFDGGVCVVALPREQVASAIKSLREADKAKVLAEPKLMAMMGRDAVFADGGELPRIETAEFADGRRIEKVEFQSLRSLRIRPEIGNPKGTIVRMSVTRENTEPIDEPDPNSETDKTRPRMITRQLTFTADVPIGRTLLVWELKPAAGEQANLVLITPEGIHRTTRKLFANPQPLALDLAFPTAQPAANAETADPRAMAQIKEALEKLRAEAASNAKLSNDMQQETARLKQQIDDLMAQLARLRSVANQDAQNQVTDAEFIRRVYLDLLGVVPAVEDVKAFLDSSDDKKREKLIDKLLGDEKVADHWAKAWKDLIARRQQIEPKTEETVAPPAAQPSVTVFRLKHLPSARGVELAQQILHGDGAINSRIVADERTNSVIFQGTSREAETLAAILKVLDQPAEVATQQQIAGDDYHATHDPATQRKLLEIDLQEAESELDLAKAEHAEDQKILKSSPGAMSPYEVRRKEAAVRQAELRLRRIKVLLDAVEAKAKPASRSLLNAIEEGIVPPKNLREQIWQTLGLSLDPAGDEFFKKVGSSFRGGLTVIDVRADSPADDRGLRKGDILVGLGRWEMRSLENVAYVLENGDVQKAGTLSFHILRDGKTLVGHLSLARTGDSGPSVTTAPPAATPDDRTTRLRLAEIDLREAQLKLEATSKQHDRLSELARKTSVPQTELEHIAIERQQAALAVERAQIVLDGLKNQPAQPPSRQ